MEREMLVATQQAAWAAQAAADAAWWGLLVNGAVVAVAIGTTFFQEWRVNRRLSRARSDLHSGAIASVVSAGAALEAAAAIFYAAGEVDFEKVQRQLASVRRTRRLIALFVAREVEPSTLISLLEMDDHLAEAERILLAAETGAGLGLENAVYNGELNDELAAAKKLISKVS